MNKSITTIAAVLVVIVASLWGGTYLINKYTGGDPDIALPSEMKADVGKLVKINANTSCKTVKWLVESDKANIIELESTKSAIFASSTSGTYKVYAWTAKGNKPSDAAVCVVTVGDNPNPPPNPTDQFFIDLKNVYLPL